ncbi:MAG: hypothetical protein ACJAXA_003425, partial [Candidatus Aldehydirespiratoraceae bacterium]
RKIHARLREEIGEEVRRTMDQERIS